MLSWAGSDCRRAGCLLCARADSAGAAVVGGVYGGGGIAEGLSAGCSLSLVSSSASALFARGGRTLAGGDVVSAAAAVAIAAMACAAPCVVVVLVVVVVSVVASASDSAVASSSVVTIGVVVSWRSPGVSDVLYMARMIGRRSSLALRGCDVLAHACTALLYSPNRQWRFALAAFFWAEAVVSWIT